MGEVYQARDTRLKRNVALKVLPESVAKNPQRRARFQHEAEVLAALSHSLIHFRLLPVQMEAFPTPQSFL